MDEPLLPDPHDRFFKETFGRVENVVPLLCGVLPSALAEAVDWSTLRREESSFLDETLAKRCSDLLFTVEWAGGPACFYCLFEHQSSSDLKMPLRLLRYMLRIWDHWEREHPNDTRLPLIFPLVLFQGTGGWRAAADLRGLVHLPEGESAEWTSFIPVFRYAVVDVSDLEVRDRIHALHVRSILELLRCVVMEKDAKRLKLAFAALNDLLRCQGNDLAYIRTALTYLFRASGDIDRPVFREQIQLLENNRIKEEAMSIAEMLRKEGREEGLEEGHERGREEGLERGLVLARQDDILEVLELRFGHLPVDIPSSVRSVSDGEKLR
ncbi:Rpn family recombination-promoting nuclease/putative transposase, partial [Arthrospira platensis SPKY2]